MKPITTFKDHAHRLLTRDYPKLTDKQRTKVIDRYIKAVTTEINQKLCRFMLDDGRYIVSTKKINLDSRSTVNGKQIYMHNWFMNNCPLIQIVNLGSNLKSKYTEVKMNYNLEIMIDAIYADLLNKPNLTDDERIEVAKQLYTPEFYDIIKQANEEVDYTPVDLDSLQAYIDYIAVEMTKTSKYSADGIETLDRRIKEAKRMHSIARAFNGNLPQIINESDFGRKYYKGPNLQSVSKEVRHAALGKCIEYDIENSVYAWRYTETMRIGNEAGTDIHLPNTLNYLERKKEIREEIAQHTFAGSKHTLESAVKIIKQAFTAISFGARGSTSAAVWYSNGEKHTQAISAIIYSQVHRKLFLEHPFVSAFIKEQKVISDIIFECYSKQPEIKQVSCIQTEAGKLSKTKTLAYLYQQQERILLDAAVQQLKADNVLLTVHDAFYIKYADAEGIKSAKYELKEYNKELDLERIAHAANRSTVQTQADIDIAAHHNRIQQQENKARNYVPRNLQNWATETCKIIPMEEILYERNKQAQDKSYTAQLEEQVQKDERVKAVQKDIDKMLKKGKQ